MLVPLVRDPSNGLFERDLPLALGRYVARIIEIHGSKELLDATDLWRVITRALELASSHGMMRR
jgi:hypothetical protein